MTDRPILFSGSMVRALLEGRKTQTRRVFKPRGFEFYTHPVSGDRYNQYRPYRDGTWDESRISGSGSMQSFGWGESLYAYLPYAPGDRLWVREQWKTSALYDDTAPRDLPQSASIYFTADDRLWPVARYRPGMFLPRWASRLTLIVADIRVERLNEISEDDAKAEGMFLTQAEIDANERLMRRDLLPHIQAINGNKKYPLTCRTKFVSLWCDIHGGLDAWDENPWVVAVTFTIHRRNIDSEAA